MTDDQQADIKQRAAAVAGLAATLQAELLMYGVYQEMSAMGDLGDDYNNEITGARQAACAAFAKIEENLTILKGYCDA